MTTKGEFIGYAALQGDGTLCPGVIRRPVSGPESLQRDLDRVFPQHGPHTVVELRSLPKQEPANG